MIYRAIVSAVFVTVCSKPRLGTFDGLLEVLEFDVGVDLRRVQVAVAEELLHVADAGAATQEMSGAAVAEGVDCGFEFNLDSVVANALGDHLIRQTAAGD